MLILSTYFLDDTQTLEMVGDLFEEDVDETNYNEIDYNDEFGETSGLRNFRNYYNLESGGKQPQDIRNHLNPFKRNVL